MIRQKLCIHILLILILPNISIASAMDITPFMVTNQSPLAHIYGIPSNSQSFVTQKGKYSTSISLDIASSSTSGRNEYEEIWLDGEITRITTSIGYGFANGFEAGFNLPIINHGGGFLDQFIINWHDAFSLPQGERTSTPKNRLSYFYQKDDFQKLKMYQSGTYLGDVTTFAAMNLLDVKTDFSRASMALRGDLKLPTGDSSRLAGSGSLDLAISATASYNRYNRWGTMGIYGSSGLLTMTKGNVLPDQQNQLVFFGTVGAGLSPAKWISLKLQLNGHSPLYTGSKLTELNSSSLMLTSGGALKLADSYILDIAVSEDIAVATAPDVSFHLALSHQF